MKKLSWPRAHIKPTRISPEPLTAVYMGVPRNHDSRFGPCGNRLYDPGVHKEDPLLQNAQVKGALK